MRAAFKEFKNLCRSGKNSPAYLGCLVCGVDSKPVLTFFLWLVGAGLTASICFFMWGFFTGKFTSDEAASMIPLDAENIKNQ